MKTPSFFLMLLAVTVGLAQQGFESNRSQQFPGQDLNSLEKMLVDQAKQSGFAFNQLLNVPTHSLLMVHRSGATPPEEHSDVTDIWIIKTGSGTVQIGGEMVDPKNVDASNVLGTSIRGAETFRANAGDYFNIPPNVPHRMLLDPGKSITYLIVKVRER